jgi:hypothetical protein
MRIILTASLALAIAILAPVGSAFAAAGKVAIGSATLGVAETNIARAANNLVIYQSPLTVSPANQWGAEAAVVSGKVTEVRDQQTSGPSPLLIPAGGVVLSGHGTARNWLLKNAKVGVFLTLPGETLPPPPPPPPPAPPFSVITYATISGSSFAVAGTNIDRAANKLVIYDLPPASAANVYGAEAAVNSMGRVTLTSDRQTTNTGQTAIPPGGYVLSGHGTARSWLLAKAKVGAEVTLARLLR